MREPAATSNEPGTTRLHDQDIEQIARRVAQLIGYLEPAPRYVDATDLAQMLGVGREWVYEHARSLGAIRLGGPSGRLRFDVRQVVETLTPPPPRPRPARHRGSRRRGSQEERTQVIQYERWAS